MEADLPSACWTAAATAAPSTWLPVRRPCGTTLTVEAERLERRFAAYPRDHVARNDIDLYIRVSNSLRNLLDMTGLERKGPKTIVPTIDQYVAEREAAE